MKKLELSLPEHVNEGEVKFAVAAVLFDRGELTSGQAAEMAGVTKRYFLENVGKYGISIFQYTADELKEELDNF